MSSFEKIKETILQGRSFILEAGAGSGKTHILIQTVNFILETQSEQLIKRGQKIACITFTNVAKDQIIERTGGNPLVQAQTIHEFLWECIANYQKQLHLKLEELNKYYQSKRSKYEYIDNLEKETEGINITYWDYGRRFLEGKITHEDVLLLSNFMFRDFKRLSDMIADKFPFLFVDEYQDTENETIELILDFHLLKNSSKVIVGFFGDSMQKIYNKGVGKIPQKYVDNGTLEFITKQENFRSSTSIVSLLNQIRTNLQQIPIKEQTGKASFVYNNSDFEEAKRFIIDNNLLDFDNDVKTLFLTHRTIAKKGGFLNLHKVYSDRYKRSMNQRLFDKDDRYSNFFMGERSIEKLIEFYEAKNYNEFIHLLGKTGFRVNYHLDKVKIRQEINELIERRRTGTVKDVLDYIKEKDLIAISERIKEFEKIIPQEMPEPIEDIVKDYTFFTELMKVPYQEWLNVYDYVEQNTPFSTKHNTKGDEYDNVLVVIDDEAWKNQYNFDKMISNSDNSENRFERTLNLFYVCCSRAKKNLVILALSQISETTKQKAIEWFGQQNVYEIN